MKFLKLLIADLLLFFFVYSAEAQIVVTSTTASTYGPPTVTTNSPSSITENTVVLGGTITNNGGKPITEKGIYWSHSKDGNEQKLIINDDTESDSFESTFKGFLENTCYYVRAYATNSAGTSYGKQLVFKTKKGRQSSIRKKGLAIRPEIGIGAKSCLLTTNSLCNVVYLFNTYFSIGGGTGFYYMYDNLYDNNYLSVPLYANARLYFCNRKVSPYFDVKLGYIHPIIRNSYSCYLKERFSGFYSNFIFGLDYKNFNIGINIDLFKRKWRIRYYYHDWYYNNESKYEYSIGLNFGYNFKIKKKK